MATQTQQSQGLLFSEPSIAETGVWCSLNEGIDPKEWASVCRFIGNLSPREFGIVRRKVVGSPNSLRNRVKRVFCCSEDRMAGMPLVSFGPSGIGGEYQREGGKVKNCLLISCFSGSV